MQFSFFTTIYEVSEITRRLRDVLESDDVLSDVWVQGEVSNSSRAASGHFYFSLKDEQAALRCVMWKGAASKLPRIPREGEYVHAHGKFSVYEARGDVQLYVDELQLLGAGELWQQFEALKQKLAADGLFDEGRKRTLPRFPRNIGVVTSRSGAVLKDILHILERRYPLPHVYLASTPVQGYDAPPKIVAALRRVQQVRDLDVIILARGGGSIEDLWAFNDERVARAIVAARVPVICGVGHETDFTIADFCADVRAPTPTAAAQFCTPDQNELRANIMLAERRLARVCRLALEDARERRKHDIVALRRLSPRARIDERRQQLDDLTRAAGKHIVRRITLQRAQLRGAERQLQALNPLATLDRGYAIVRTASDGKVVSSSSQVKTDQRLRVRVRDDEFGARVE